MTLTAVNEIMRRFSELPTESDRQAREIVVAGLLRRAFVTAQSIAELLFRGHADSAMALSRTLVEILLTTVVITNDPTDRMARRLVGYDYYWRHKYGHKLLSDPETRTQIETDPGGKDRTAAISRSWRDQFEGRFFEDVREDLLADLRQNRGWHGLGGTEAAFQSVNRGVDYLRSFTLSAPFVHGINVEWDFDKVEDGKPFLRDPIEWDGDRLRAPLGMAMFRLHEVTETCVRDRLDAPSLSNPGLHERRKDMLREAKARLLELQVALVECFGPDPLDEKTTGFAAPSDAI